MYLAKPRKCLSNLRALLIASERLAQPLVIWRVVVKQWRFPLPAPCPINGEIAGDGEQPGVKRPAVILIGRQPVDRAAVGLRDEVLRAVVVAHQRVGEPVDRRRGLIVQLAEGIGVGPGGNNQFCLVHARRVTAQMRAGNASRANG